MYDAETALEGTDVVGDRSHLNTTLLEEEKKIILEKKEKLMTLNDEMSKTLKEITLIFQILGTSYTLTGDLEMKRSKA